LFYCAKRNVLIMLAMFGLGPWGEC